MSEGILDPATGKLRVKRCSEDHFKRCIAINITTERCSMALEELMKLKPSELVDLRYKRMRQGLDGHKRDAAGKAIIAAIEEHDRETIRLNNFA